VVSWYSIININDYYDFFLRLFFKLQYTNKFEERVQRLNIILIIIYYIILCVKKMEANENNKKYLL